MIIITPQAGDHKKLIIGAGLLTASSTLVLAIFFFLGQGSLWLIFLFSAIRSIGAGIQMPAVNAVIPQLVPESRLMRVNGINGSVMSLVMLISPVVSGTMMAGMRIEAIFFVNVGTATLENDPAAGKSGESLSGKGRGELKEGND